MRGPRGGTPNIGAIFTGGKYWTAQDHTVFLKKNVTNGLIIVQVISYSRTRSLENNTFALWCFQIWTTSWIEILKQISKIRLCIHC